MGVVWNDIREPENDFNNREKQREEGGGRREEGGKVITYKVIK